MRPKYLFKGLIFSAVFGAAILCSGTTFAESQNTNQSSDPVNSQESTTYLSYTVKPGETLSEILRVKFNIKHLYGPDGWVQKSFLMNKGKIMKKGDLIIAGDEILLPVSEVVAEEVAVKAEARQEKRAAGEVLTGEAQVEVSDAKSAKEPAPSKIDKDVKTVCLKKEVRVPADDKSEITKSEKSSAEKPKEEFVPYSKFKVDLDFNYVGLYGKEKSNGTSATLLSGLTPELNLSWMQQWTPEIFSSEHLFMQQIAIQPDQNGRGLDNSNLMNTGFGIDAGKNLTEKLVLAAGLGVGQELFYVGAANGNLKLNQVPILKLRPSAEWTFVKIKPFRAALFGGVSYYGSSSYDVYSIQSGFGYDAGLTIVQDFAKSSFDVKLMYSERQQNTSLLIFSEKQIGLSLGYSWGGE